MSPLARSIPSPARRFRQEFKKLQEKLGKTIVFVTHDVGEALLLGDRIALMEEGQLARRVHADRNSLRPTDELAQTYLRERTVHRTYFAD